MSKPRAWESRDWKNLSDSDRKAVDNFREYLRIPTAHPDVDYEPCVSFLEKLAEDIGLNFGVYRNIPKNPVVVLSWIGTEPTLPSIMLNSHMDVVPASEENWKFKPFNADVDENGDIYARGAQDSKNYTVQYLEAIRRLKQDGFKPKRTVHVSLMPDEEHGGVEGMQKFVRTSEFKKLHVGFALDEGFDSEDDFLTAFYGEKVCWGFVIHCSGPSGHGALFLEDTASEKVQRVLKKMYQFRETQKNVNIDDAVAINLTRLMGGTVSNTIPNTLSLVFDTRSPVEQLDNFEKFVLELCGEGVELETYLRQEKVENTKVDGSNPFWGAFKTALDNLGLTVELRILPATTDARFMREVGVPCIGFCTMRNTIKRAHDINEYLNINVFLDGIIIYKEIIASLAGV